MVAANVSTPAFAAALFGKAIAPSTAMKKAGESSRDLCQAVGPSWVTSCAKFCAKARTAVSTADDCSGVRDRATDDAFVRAEYAANPRIHTSAATSNLCMANPRSRSKPSRRALSTGLDMVLSVTLDSAAMINLRNFVLVLAALVAVSPAALGKKPQESLAFTVSMPQPANHTFHIALRADGLKGELQDFKMPVWSPGFYVVGDYSRNVSGFRVEDAAGHALPWEKVTKNTWRVAAGGAKEIDLSYDVYGDISFAANSYLGPDRAYISPSGVFVYIPG